MKVLAPAAKGRKPDIHKHATHVSVCDNGNLRTFFIENHLYDSLIKLAFWHNVVSRTARILCGGQRHGADVDIRARVRNQCDLMTSIHLPRMSWIVASGVSQTMTSKGHVF